MKPPGVDGEHDIGLAKKLMDGVRVGSGGWCRRLCVIRCQFVTWGCRDMFTCDFISPQYGQLCHVVSITSVQEFSVGSGNDFLSISTLRPRWNGRHIADDTFKRILVNENVRILIEISLKFVPKGPINNTPALVQIMAWHCPGDKPSSEPMMVSSLTHICVTRPQSVRRQAITPTSDGFAVMALRSLIRPPVTRMKFQ